MARVSLSEYRAKQLLTESYKGVRLRMSSLEDDTSRLDGSVTCVVKVDQGVKKRGKQGLLRLNVARQDVLEAVKELAKKGFESFLAEPMVPHESGDERYLSIERTREGMKFLYSSRGGVEVEEHASEIEVFHSAHEVPLPGGFVEHIVAVMDREQLSFVEINPLIVKDDKCILLDAAVLADSAGIWRASWDEDAIVSATHLSESEQAVKKLDEGSPSAFSFRVLNPDGAIWLLLSGGGASITIADEAANQGKAGAIGNYGEYSGGPTREETKVYTEAVLKQMFASKAPQKAIIIAGGVANFTDIKKTFGGVIDALEDHLEKLKTEEVKVFVRRGGPNEAEGLAHMEAFLRENGLLGSVHGSDDVLTVVVNEAMEYVGA